MMKQLNEAHVVAVLYDEVRDTPFVLLKVLQNNACISLPLNPFEASSIIMASEALVTPQPRIHDVVVTLLREQGCTAEFVELWGSNLSGYYGRLRYRGRLFHHYLSVGPADSLVLALRLHIPIFLDNSMVQSAQNELPDSIAYSSGNNQVLYLDSSQPVQSI
ncbi:bifunctional nuclease domain-containing protein [Gracilinema caldarium]|uniref:bifunctional nuclease domain-containing protein n=1 Tax=Gracilinema caldarium TaxID=215591 RepID=UPI0026F2FEF7|nr:bifunctional nuclease domain-containing protein [Gracilinema caldarium]